MTIPSNPTGRGAVLVCSLAKRYKPGAKSASTSVAPRIRGALESRGTGHLSDQSILNHHFKGRWRQLPYGYNVGHKVHAVNRKLWGQIELASIHFVGRPKPWEVEPGSYRPGRGAPDATLTRRWHDTCRASTP